MGENKEKGGRKLGRPFGGIRDYGKCDVRLTKYEMEMLDYLAERNNVTKSTIMRKALKDFYKFNTSNEK